MLSFFVTGQPQPAPKVETAQTRSGRKYIYKRDRTGSKLRWAENVRLCARRAMHNQNFKIIPERVGVTVDYHFYFRQFPSNKDDAMVIKPDESNLIAALDNALKGLCFNDDNQINRHLVCKTYASDKEAEGVVIWVWRTGEQREVKG